MVLRYNTAIRIAQGNAVSTDAGATAKLELRTGTQPATVATAASGSVLSTHTCAATFGTTAAVGNVVTLTLNAVASATATGAGTAGWFRLYKTDGTTPVFDGSVTITGGGGDLTLNNPAITIGGTVAISSGSIVIGNP